MHPLGDMLERGPHLHFQVPPVIPPPLGRGRDEREWKIRKVRNSTETDVLLITGEGVPLLLHMNDFLPRSSISFSFPLSFIILYLLVLPTSPFTQAHCSCVHWLYRHMSVSQVATDFSFLFLSHAVPHFLRI